jgi:hypothetical protein
VRGGDCPAIRITKMAVDHQNDGIAIAAMRIDRATAVVRTRVPSRRVEIIGQVSRRQSGRSVVGVKVSG